MSNKKHTTTIANNARGQGLIESIVAITIITVGLSSILGLVIAGVAGEQIASSQIVAANLSREGIEVVRNIRDTNWMNGAAWDAGLDSGIPAADLTAVVQYNTGSSTLDFNPDPNCEAVGAVYPCRLYLGSGTNSGLYSHTATGQPLNYWRLIKMYRICRDETIDKGEDSGSHCNSKIGIQIISEVYWQEHGRSHTIAAEDRIYNWR
ncbi:MAG: hypothetical protein HY973_00195 [Candidatus Kerfeldbacteria bacterium]|nr:hypothetical protein [Candidatus Kerfeldbacteria bacterium]